MSTTSEASRKVGRDCGVRNGGGIGGDDVAYGSFRALLLALAHLLEVGAALLVLALKHVGDSLRPRGASSSLIFLVHSATAALLASFTACEERRVLAMSEASRRGICSQEERSDDPRRQRSEKVQNSQRFVASLLARTLVLAPTLVFRSSRQPSPCRC